MIDALIIATLFILALLGVVLHSLMRLHRELIETRREQQDWLSHHQNWLYKSLNELNYKVDEPGKPPAPDEVGPASVYTPSLDPMAEFTGDQDDWFD